jgi:hypothetical protein
MILNFATCFHLTSLSGTKLCNVKEGKAFACKLLRLGNWMEFRAPILNLRFGTARTTAFSYRLRLHLTTQGNSLVLIFVRSWVGWMRTEGNRSRCKFSTILPVFEPVIYLLVAQCPNPVRHLLHKRYVDVYGYLVIDYFVIYCYWIGIESLSFSNIKHLLVFRVFKSVHHHTFK